MEELLQFAAAHKFLAAGTVVSAVLVIIAEYKVRTGRGTTLVPQDAVQMMNRGGVPIDVRSQDRYASGHILNARNIPLADLTDKADSVHKSRDKPVLVYCDNGVTGSRAAGILKAAGYTQVFNLKGGLTAWLRENLPTVTGSKKKKG